MKLKNSIIVGFMMVILVPMLLFTAALFGISESQHRNAANNKSVQEENYDITISDTGNSQARIQIMTKDLFFTAFIILIFTGVSVGLWIYRSVAAPLVKLRKATQNIKDGNLDFVLDVEGTDEFSELCRDFEEAYSLRGVPFLDARCYDGCGNYIIYGHYMKDGTMFGSLQAYAKPAYCEAHPTITLNTATGCADYTVMAAFYSQVYSQEDSRVFRYYQYADLSNEADFAAYVEQVQKAALYDTGVNAQYGEQLLTLSTCSYHTDEGRFVVVAKKQE